VALGGREYYEVATTLDFIRTNGGDADRAVLEKILPEVDPRHKNELTAAIIYLRAKVNSLNCLSYLIDNNIEDVPDDVITIIFQKPASVSTAKLRQCLVLKSAKLRRSGAEQLNKRDAMTVEEAIHLFSDNDPAARLTGAECLLRHGKIMTDEELRSALIFPSSTGLGLSLSANRGSDDKYYKAYIRTQLYSKNYSDLSNIAKSCDVFAYLELSTLYERFTKRCFGEIEQNLADGFKKYFDQKFNEVYTKFGSTTKLFADEGVELFLRQRLTSVTLDALCAWAGKSALDTVRKTIDNYEVHFSEKSLDI
jgi:hypothetical protein